MSPRTRSMDEGAMTFDHDRPYFNMTIAACRRAGAKGGHRSAMSRKLRQMNQVRVANVEVHVETAAEAMALLDQQFPWLRGAERGEARARGLAHTAPPGPLGASGATKATHEAR